MLERQLSRAYIFQILRYAPEKCGHKLRNSVLIPYFHSICRQFAPDSFKEHIFSYSCCLFFTAVYLFHYILLLRSVIPPIAVFGTFSFTPSDGLLGGFLQVIYLPISVSRF